MLYSFFLCLFFILNLLNISSTTTTTTSSPLTVSSKSPLITHFLVFASNLETVISFEPKHGWILNEERKLRLHLSGINLQNSSIVFTPSVDECTSNDYISPIYSLSSAAIIELDVELQSISKSHSSIYVCLLTPSNTSLALSNNKSESENVMQLDGPYFTLLREKGRLPFAAKICLILMLFIVSGFFR
jgi:hypothetical protein